MGVAVDSCCVGARGRPGKRQAIKELLNSLGGPTMNVFTPEPERAKSLELSFVDLEQQTKLHLDRGTVAATRWFDDHGKSVLGAPRSEQPAQQVEVLLRFVQWHFKEGQHDQGLVFALRAVQVARSSGLLALLRRSLNLLGLMYSRVGNLPEATVSYVEGLQIAEQIGDRIGKAAVLANLAELRFNNGLIGESMALNRYVVDIAANEPQFIQLIADAHHNIAVAALLLNDIDTAKREIEEAVRISRSPTNQFLAHQSVIVESTYCRILIEIGLPESARRCAQRAEGVALRMNSQPAMVQASVASALCDAAQGKVGLAFDRLSTAREVVSSNDPLYRDLLEIEATCHEIAGRKTDAARLRKAHLSHLARFQRASVIRQVAAFQRSIRALRAVPEPELAVLPVEARKRLLNSWDNREKDELFREYLEALASLADQREDGGGEHCFRVGHLAQLLASHCGQSGSRSQLLGLAARLHDIGKLAVPDVLLLKPGPLTHTEAEIVRRHTIEGSQILTDIFGTIERSGYAANSAESVRTAIEIALHHHEWWDGTGYPRRVRDRQIPESARITAIADVFDELTAARPYRHPLSASDAILHMKRLRGSQFDPTFFDAFSDLVANLQRSHGQELKGLPRGDGERSAYQKAIRVIERIASSSRCFNRTTARDSNEMIC
jgi:HD-GYP domain-containing protein (c-di-GMP phosphodiesterase class II)